MTNSEINNAVQMYESGFSTVQIAEKYSCNTGTIWYHLTNRKVQIKKRRTYSKEEKEKLCEQIIKLANQNIGGPTIAKMLNTSTDMVYRTFYKAGIDTSRIIKQRKVPLDHKLIASLYQEGKTTTEIANMFDSSEGHISVILKQQGIKARPNNKYSFNKSFFDKIDTPEKAWFLGLMYTDGNNSRAGLRVAMCDKDVLEKLKAIIGYDGPITMPKLGKNSKTTQYLLQISNKELSNRLIELGCPPKKSLLLKFPSEQIVPKHLLPHFILGAWDGDGSITKDASITGTIEFLTGIKNSIQSVINIPDKDFHWYCRHPKRNTNTRSMHISKKEFYMPFLNWIYKDSAPHMRMDRKYNKYVALCEKHNSAN